MSLGLGLGLALWVLFMAPWSPLSSIELGAYDYRFTLQDRVARPAPEIVIVDIDDASLEAFGEFPWPRRLHAKLIRKLQDWGARVIAFDVVFQGAGPDPAGDLELRQAIAGAGNVVLAGIERDIEAIGTPASGEGAGAGEPGPGESVMGGPRLDGPVAPGVGGPGASGLPGGRREGAKVSYREPFFSAPNGAVSMDPDEADGALRSHVLVGRSSAPSFELAILRMLDPALADRILQRHGSGRYRIRFAGPPGTYPTVSYARVLEGILDPRIDPEIHPDAPQATRTYADFFRGRIVLVGSSAPLLHDTFHAPFARGDVMMPGVEIHANALDTLRRGDAPRSAPWGMGLAITVGMAIGAALVFSRLRPSFGLLGVLTLVALYGSLCVVVFRQGIDLPVMPPIAAAGLAWPAVQGRRIMAAEREKARIRATFSRYVAPRVVEEMLKHPDQLPGLRNERRHVTVLFTDIEGFTTFAETHPPDLVATRLNEVLSALTQVVFDHGGTLDKYIGDAVMAVWGNIGPSDPRADALNAVRAAMQMQREMERLRAAWETDPAAPPLRIRIGIHSGEALVGNFGSPLKLDFTAIGDTVNTASRLEGLNKQFGTSILISGSTAAFVEDVVQTRPLGESMLKGKSTGTLVFEVPLDLQAKVSRAPSGPQDGAIVPIAHKKES